MYMYMIMFHIITTMLYIKNIFDNIKNNIEKNTINVNSKRTLAGLYNFDEDADVKFLKENYNLDVFGVALGTLFASFITVII